MKGTIRSLAAVVAVVMTAACSDANPTASSFVEPEAGAVMAASNGSSLTFSSTQSHDSQTPQTATGGTGYIDFSGSLTTGNPCYSVSATHTAKGTDITVTVSAASTGDMCIQVITFNNYTGRVSGLSAGTYNFTVVHKNAGSRTGTTAYSGQVIVL